MTSSQQHRYHAGEITTIEDLDRRMQSVEQPVLLLEGMRALPPDDVDKVRACGRFFARRYPTAWFRSGNAPGTDTAFAEGVVEVAPDRLQVVLPYPTHRKKALLAPTTSRYSLEGLPAVAERHLVDVSDEASPDLRGLGAYYLKHGAKGAAGSKATYILRDTMKVVGVPALNLAPATAGIFYVNPSDPLAGGTGHTVRVCLLRGVSTVYQDIWLEWGVGRSGTDPE